MRRLVCRLGLGDLGVDALMINGDLLMRGLVVFYIILAGVFLYERNWPKAWYWLAAAQITGSVLVMK